MNFKSILLTALATLGLSATTMAQNVPNYVPTNGLVGWWPLDANANDLSGNNYNGTAYFVTPTTNRNNQMNSALMFNGIELGNGSTIEINDTILNIGQSQYSISLWFNPNNLTQITRCLINTNPHTGIAIAFNDNNAPGYCVYDIGPANAFWSTLYNHGTFNNFQPGNWYNVILVKNGTNYYQFINGVLENSITVPAASSYNYPVTFRISGISSQYQIFDGAMDDIGIWNRALTQQEITDLYSAVNCANNTTITPQTNSLATGSTATFTSTTSDPNPSFVWQSDFGQGFQTLNNFGNYSGVNTNSLSIANVQLSEHNQPIRVISTSGNCIDTSNVAVINILDTCITTVSVYDTLLTTVTDTLVINATITGINPPNNLNTLKVFPNPASTHITIDYGNYNAMSGYTLKIVNAVGQTVFTTPINQQTSYIDLSTWTGNGIYFLQLIDPQNNTIENRKIVIQ